MKFETFPESRKIFELSKLNRQESSVFFYLISPISLLRLDVRSQLRNNSGLHPRSNNNAAFLHGLLRYSCDYDLKIIKNELT